MLKSVIGMQNKGGFTLIEILVVVLIFGITLGFALLAFGDFGRTRQLIISAEQFINYIKFAEQQAILETSTLGIVVDVQGYQLVRLQSRTHWQSMPHKAIFHHQRFPSNAIVHLDNSVKGHGSPQIIINSSGDITAFTLNLGSDEQTNIVQVIGARNGDVSLKRIKAP